MADLYDTIGRSYITHRAADPRVAEQVLRAVGEARSIVNVGAGTGSYEPRDRWVVALEPSQTMIGQRPSGPAALVRGAAEALCFRDKSFEAALAIFTIHHWSNASAGLREMQRVADRW